MYTRTRLILLTILGICIVILAHSGCRKVDTIYNTQAPKSIQVKWADKNWIKHTETFNIIYIDGKAYLHYESGGWDYYMPK